VHFYDSSRNEELELKFQSSALKSFSLIRGGIWNLNLHAYRLPKFQLSALQLTLRTYCTIARISSSKTMRVHSREHIKQTVGRNEWSGKIEEILSGEKKTIFSCNKYMGDDAFWRTMSFIKYQAFQKETNKWNQGRDVENYGLRSGIYEIYSDTYVVTSLLGVFKLYVMNSWTIKLRVRLSWIFSTYCNVNLRNL
jgi:hypothetical protein